MNDRQRKRSLEQMWMLSAILVLIVLVASASASAQGWVATRRGSANRDFNSVHFVNSERGWVAGDRGAILRTDDGGRTWTSQNSTVNQNINDIYFRNGTDGFFLAGSRLFSTTTGGTVWSEARRFSPADFDSATPELYSIVFANNRKGWIVGSVSRRDTVVDSLVLHTEDGGATWIQQRPPVRDELIDLDFVSDERGFVVGARGTILHTRDGGRTWMVQLSGTTATLYGVDFRGGRSGWAVGERATVLRTIDGGEHWSAINAMPQSRGVTLLSVKFTNNNDGFIVGRGGLVLRSGDGGRTWVRQESGTTEHLYALAIEGRNNWAVGGGSMVIQYRR